ncbi:MAG TPA: response regulator [Chryseolinea sp.]|nr:response regulator [Chryseolinea sp.]
MNKVVNILLVEDDHLDIIDMKRTLDKMHILNNLVVAKNGEDAIQILNDKASSSEAIPDIALIDINMPKMNGLEFLSAVRKMEAWKDLKCFIITTSDEKVDRTAAKELGISGYIVKPLKLNNPSSMDAFNLMIDLMNFQK